MSRIPCHRVIFVALYLVGEFDTDSSITSFTNSKLFIVLLSILNAFDKSRGNEPNPLPSGYFCRTIFSAIVLESSRGDVLSLRVHGNGFLYRMVRIMVGSACRVACGRMPLEQLADSLSTPSSLPVAFCAPPDGLYLLRVDYPFSTAKGTIY